MTPDQIRTVQSSWSKVLPIKDAAAQLFAQRLLDADSSLVCLVPGDTRRQGARLVRLIDAAVLGLGRLHRNAALAHRAGRRYASCAITQRQLETIGTALTWTLGKCLGTDFTPEAKDAWATVYAEVVASMRDASFAVRLGDSSQAHEPALSNSA